MVPSGAASTDGHPEDFRPPRPLRTAVLPSALISLPAALWALGAVPADAAAGFALSLAFFALLLGGLGAYELHRSRRLGDGLLRAYPHRPPVSGLAAWRSDELTSPRSRRKLMRLLRRLEREAESCMKRGTQQVDSAVLVATLVLLHRLERRLETLSEPVSPLGILDGFALAAGEPGPRSYPERAAGLPAALVRVLAALEPR